MIDPSLLLADLQRLRADLESDLRERCEEHPNLETSLQAGVPARGRAETNRRRHLQCVARRTSHAGGRRLDSRLRLRSLPRGQLPVDPPRLSGSGERRRRALDEHTLYFRKHPTDTDREYLLHVFRAVAALPVADQIFDEKHNPLWSLGPSGDAATMLLGLWQRIDPDSGTLVHDFTDPAWDTRFLGDLYQNLSESARKRYALLQTPEFVEEFILDRTLTPAIEEFGFREVRLIDPACGSGHFLLGAFRRLDALWARNEPGTNPRGRASRVLEQVAGVDLNPFAAAIARFRLCVAALRASDVRRLADAPGFELRVAAGDSLLHGPRPGLAGARQEYLEAVTKDPLGHVYRTEDAEALRSILGRRYHVVVGNPPYITPKDKALNQGYRERFGSCHRKYSLAVPFTERFFDLAHAPAPGAAEPAGFVGMITANSFMKREFGRKLIEEFIPRWDLNHVVDTSGAYIPGHGTPTVILFGRHRRPVNGSVRAVMGIRGEPAIPDDAAKGLVWSAIVAQIDQPGSQTEFVSVSEVSRERFQRHPWVLGGGGAAEVKVLLDQVGGVTLGHLADSIGITSFTLEDDIYLLAVDAVRRRSLPADHVREMVVGDLIRDWGQQQVLELAAFPYGTDYCPIANDPEHPILRYLWPARTKLANSRMFGGKTKTQTGLWWYEYGRLTRDKLRTPLSITFAFVGTHNHFVLDRGGKVFKQSAPVIKLPEDAGEDDHLELLGLLNSSTACFWMKQVFHNKGSSVDQHVSTPAYSWVRGFLGARRDEAPEVSSTRCTATRPRTRPRHAGTGADPNAARGTGGPWIVGGRVVAGGANPRPRNPRKDGRSAGGARLALLSALRRDGGRRPAYCPPAKSRLSSLGERAFEIVLARRIAAGEVETKWFERHGSTPITEIPEHWPAAYRALVRRRIEAIENNASVALIEQPEYKRRWNDEPWETQQERALRGWLLDRLETPSLWSEPRLTTTAALADRMREDPEFLQVAELYSGRPDFDVAKLVAGLVENESVPLLAVLRYKPSGLRKRAAWESTWDLQRHEDEIDARVELPGLGSRTPHAGGSGGAEGERDRCDPGPAAVHVGRLPEGRLVAPARQARRAEGTLRQLAVLRAGG